MSKKFIIFVDADAFVAAVKQQDSTHIKAYKLFQQLEERSAILITSNYVFSETVTVLSQRVSHEAAVTYIENMKSHENLWIIEQVDEFIEEEAIEIFKKQTSKNTSFVDCTNMAFLKKLHADAIFSFDGIYRKNGFMLLEDLVAGKN